jgi:hypothetical protein
MERALVNFWPIKLTTFPLSHHYQYTKANSTQPTLDMIRLMLFAASPRGIRMNWLRHANLALFPDELRADLDELHKYFPSLAIVVPGVLSQVSAKDVGRFFTTLERTAIFSMTFLLQYPVPEQIQRYCDAMQNYMEVECPGCPALRELDLKELAAFCQVKLDAHRLSNLRFIVWEAKLPPPNNPEACWIARAFVEPLTVEVQGAMAQAHIPTCRANMSFREFVQASRGYKDAMLHSKTDIPWTYLGESDGDVISDVDDDLQPTGERVPLKDFCKPAQNVPKGSACSVCMTDVDKNDKDEEQPVVTKCAHFFHQICLDSWVNESAMNGANACPQCRTELCQARAREPVAELEYETEEAEDDEVIDSMQEETLYAEGKTDRENGLFSRLRSRFRRR